MPSFALWIFMFWEVGGGGRWHVRESCIVLSCLMPDSPHLTADGQAAAILTKIPRLALWLCWRVHETDRWHFRGPNPMHAGIASSPLGEWDTRQRKWVNGGINVNYVNGLIEKGLTPACASARAETASINTRVGNKWWQMEWPLDIINKP